MSSVNDDSDGLRRHVTRSVGWIVVERWGSRLLQLVVVAVLTRVLDPASFGLVALATAVVAVLQVFVDSGLPKALIQLKELDKKDASTAFWTSLALSVAAYLVLFFTAPLLSSLMGHGELTLILRVMGLSLPIWAFSRTPAALLERTFDFRILSLRQLVAAVGGALVAIPLAFAGGGVWALVAQVLVTAVVACAVLWATSDWRPKFEYSGASLKKIWGVGLSIMGTAFLDAVQGNIDKLVIGLAFTSEILGYYYLAQRISLILTELVTSVISRVSLTTFSRVQDDLPRLRRIFGQMTLVAGIVGVPIFALTAVLAPQLIPVISGEGWEDAIPILWGLLAGSTLAAVMYFDRTALLARGKAQSAFWLAALQNAVGLVLVFALLPLGVVGVVISRWARVFVWPVRLWVLKRAIGLEIRHYIAQILRPLVAIAPIVIGVGLLQKTGWAQGDFAFVTFALPVGLVSLALYGAIAWWTTGAANRVVLRPLLRVVIDRFGRRGGKGRK